MTTTPEQPTSWAAGDAPRPAQAGDQAPPAARPRPFRWGGAATLVWGMIIIATSFVAAGLLAVAVATVENLDLLQDMDILDDPDRLVAVLLQAVRDHLAALTAAQALVMIMLVVALTRGRGGLTRSRMLALDRFRFWRTLGWTVAIMGTLALLWLGQRLVFGDDEAAMRWVTWLNPVWLAVLLVVVLAPLSEELLFRGFLYGGLAASPLGPLGAVIFTAAVWALIHVQYDWPQVAQIFGYGVILGVARWRSGSLWPPLLGHGLNNVVALIGVHAMS